MKGIASLAVGLVWPCQDLMGQVERIATSATILEVIEAVEKHHVRPPTRQEMVLEAVRRLYDESSSWKHTGFTPNVSADLSSAVSKLTTKEEMVAFIDQVLADTKSLVEFDDMASSIIGTARLPKPVNVGRPARMTVRHRGAGGFVTHPQPVEQGDDDVGVQIRENRYVGIGIRFIKSGEGYLEAHSVLPRGPAYRAGMQSGDYIVSIDGEATQDMAMQTYIDRLRGQEGKEVTLEVRQPDEVDVRTLTFKRGVVPQVVVEGWIEESPGSWDPAIVSDMAYAKLLEIGSSTVHDLKQIDAELKSRPDIDLGFDLVLDLRHVRTASLSHTVMLADTLRSMGELGAVVTRMGRKTFEADEDCLFPNCLIYVLVDRSVSGLAEWLAASLRRDNRVTIVGTRTAGHPFVKTAVTLSNGKSVSMMTSELLTGSTSLNRYGVTLDLPIGGLNVPAGVMLAFEEKNPRTQDDVR